MIKPLARACVWFFREFYRGWKGFDCTEDPQGTVQDSGSTPDSSTSYGYIDA